MRFLAALVLVLIPSTAAGEISPLPPEEIWRCDVPGTAVYTNVPTRSLSVGCRRPELPQLVTTYAALQEPQSIPRVVSSPPPADSSSAERPFLSWEARELQTRSGRFAPVDCQLSGKVAAGSSGTAVLTIERGGTLLDHLTLPVPAGFKPQPWKVRLRGRCRNAVVRFKLRKS